MKNKPGFEILSVSIPLFCLCWEGCLRAESLDDVNPLCQDLAAGFHPDIAPFSWSALGTWGSRWRFFPTSLPGPVWVSHAGVRSLGPNSLADAVFQAPQSPSTVDGLPRNFLLPPSQEAMGGRGVLWSVLHGGQLPALAGPAPWSPGASSLAARQLPLTCWTYDVFSSPGINNPPNAHPPTQAASSCSPRSAAPSGTARLCVPWIPRTGEGAREVRGFPLSPSSHCGVVAMPQVRLLPRSSVPRFAHSRRSGLRPPSPLLLRPRGRAVGWVASHSSAKQGGHPLWRHGQAGLPVLTSAHRSVPPLPACGATGGWLPRQLPRASPKPLEKLHLRCVLPEAQP